MTEAAKADRVLLDVTRALTTISLHAADQLGGVSVVQLRALTVLAESEPISLAELAAQMSVTASTASRLVDRLVGAHLVTRRISVDSRRKVDLRLTDTGRATLDDYDRLRLDELRARLTGLPEQRRQQVFLALPALTGALAAPDQGPAARPV